MYGIKIPQVYEEGDIKSSSVKRIRKIWFIYSVGFPAWFPAHSHVNRAISNYEYSVILTISGYGTKCY